MAIKDGTVAAMVERMVFAFDHGDGRRHEVRNLAATVATIEDDRDSLRAEVLRLQDFEIRFKLDQTGIEAREREAAELVELRAELAELRELKISGLKALAHHECGECKKSLLNMVAAAERYRDTRVSSDRAARLDAESAFEAAIEAAKKASR